MTRAAIAIALALIAVSAPAWAAYVGEGPDGPKSPAAKSLDARLRSGKINCVQWARGIEKLPGEEWERIGPGPKDPNDDLGWNFKNKWSPLARRCKAEFMRVNGTLQPPEE